MHKYNRGNHFKTLFFPWWTAVNGLWALLCSGDVIVSHWASDAFKAKWDAAWIAPKFGWRVWLYGAIVLTLVFVFEVSFRCVKKTTQEAQEREAKLITRLEEIDKAKPRIRLKEPGAVYIEHVSQTYGDRHFDSVPFLKVRFVNEPVGSYPSAKANDVRATIKYFRCSDNSLLLSIDGRWADSDQPSAINPLASKTHLLPTTFGIGEAHSLDVAYRDAQTGQCFAWNNDNYNYPFFRYEHHSLKGDRFKVEIRLLGDWVDEYFSFRFRTTHDGFVVT
jgi:hypothetical protein